MHDDLFAAFAARNEALERVDANADQVWKKVAADAVLHVARMRQTFTADDVWAHLATNANCTTHEPSALGAVFNSLRRQQKIRWTGNFTISCRASRHAAPMRIWTAGGNNVV